MKNYWLLLLLLFVCLSSVFSHGDAANNASRPALINIGALFDFNSTIGKVASMAIQEAVNDVNSNDTILHGTKLNITMRDSVCRGFLGFLQAVQLMETEVVAIIGPQSSVVAHIISSAASELQVPLLSFAATDPTLTPLNSPFFVRATNSYESQMTAIAGIVEYYGWSEVVVIFNDDEHGRNGVASLDDALVEKRCKISYKAAIIAGSGVTRDDIMGVLSKIAMLESRVIVLHVTPHSGSTIFNVASYLGMMGNGYAWISTDWLSSFLDSYSPLPSEMMSTMQGVLVLRQHIPDSIRKRAFVSRWKNLTTGSLGLNAYGLYAYDSVWILAHAIDAFLSQGGNISFSRDSRISSLVGAHLHLESMRIFDGGQALLSNILQSNLKGLTGPLKFDSQRSLLHPAYDIINVIGTGYRRVGYWSDYSRLSTIPPERLYSGPRNHSSANQQLNTVFWPDGTTTTPRGWVFPNGGKQLQIGVPIRVSFKEFVSRVRGSNDTFKGFCIDVFQAAVNLLPYPVPYQFVGFGDGSKNPNYTDLVNMIAAGNIDAAVGDIAIVTSRSKIVDFTQPFASSGLVVVAPFKKVNSGGLAFLRPFTLLTWGVIVISFIVIGVVVWLLEHRINDEFRGSPRRQCLTILLFSFSTLTFSQNENTLSCLGRMVIIIWFFVLLILTSNYTASLSSILTVQQLSSPVKGIDSLRASDGRIGYQVGSFVKQYLIEELNMSKSRLVELDSPEEYGDALRHGRIDALVDELSYVDLFLSSQCDFRIIGQQFTRSDWGFAFPRDSPLAPDLSTAILELSENGDLQRIHDKWLTKTSCSRDDFSIDSYQLYLRSFSGLFIFCGIACVIALAIYFTQICRSFHHASRKTKLISDTRGRGSSTFRHLQTIISLIDEKKDPSHSHFQKRRKTRELELSPFEDDIDDGEKIAKRKQTQFSGHDDSD